MKAIVWKISTASSSANSNSTPRNPASFWPAPRFKTTFRSYGRCWTSFSQMHLPTSSISKACLTFPRCKRKTGTRNSWRRSVKPKPWLLCMRSSNPSCCAGSRPTSRPCSRRNGNTSCTHRSRPSKKQSIGRSKRTNSARIWRRKR